MKQGRWKMNLYSPRASNLGPKKVKVPFPLYLQATFNVLYIF